MAARRLLIVLLVLLGISTLAAALVPQSDVQDATTNTTTTTRSVATAPTPPAPVTVPTVAEIMVGGKKFPVVPVRVGDQFTLLVRSRFPAQIQIPEFGVIRFATRRTPARFELLPQTPGTFGILFASSQKEGVTGKPAARLIVRLAGKKGKREQREGKARKNGSRSRARAGSNRA